MNSSTSILSNLRLLKASRISQFTGIMWLVILLSCEEHKLSDWYDTPAVYEQNFVRTPMVINQYSAWSMYNDSNISGFALTEKGTSFSLDRKEDIKMDLVVPPFNSDTINVIRFVNAKEKCVLHEAALDTHFLQRPGGVVRIVEKDFVRGWSVGPCTYEVYGFQSFTESSDSITFAGLIPKWKNLPYQEGQSITLPKGNVYLSALRGKKQPSIRVDLLLETRYDIRVNRYGTGTLDRILPDNFVRCKKSYDFNPVPKTNLLDLSHEGIFREVSWPGK